MKQMFKVYISGSGYQWSAAEIIQVEQEWIVLDNINNQYKRFKYFADAVKYVKWRFYVWGVVVIKLVL